MEKGLNHNFKLTQKHISINALNNTEKRLGIPSVFSNIRILNDWNGFFYNKLLKSETVINNVDKVPKVVKVIIILLFCFSEGLISWYIAATHTNVDAMIKIVIYICLSSFLLNFNLTSKRLFRILSFLQVLFLLYLISH